MSVRPAPVCPCVSRICVIWLWLSCAWTYRRIQHPLAPSTSSVVPRSPRGNFELARLAVRGKRRTHALKSKRKLKTRCSPKSKRKPNSLRIEIQEETSKSRLEVQEETSKSRAMKYLLLQFDRIFFLFTAEEVAQGDKNTGEKKK